jgi:hypothetical protein
VGAAAAGGDDVYGIFISLSMIGAMRRCAIALLIAGCQGSDDACAGPYFTELPVDESAIASTTIIGSFSPPAHTLPSDHGGIYLTGQAIALRAPGPLTLTSIRRTRYLASSFRTGAEDYQLEANVCGAVRLSLGHIASLPAELASLIQPGGCTSYSTANETVEACYTRVAREIAAGTPLGTVGGPTAPAFDFGVYDSRHHNAFANPRRYNSQMSQALCPWDVFAPGAREVLLSRVGMGTQRRMGEPACGTMEVDRPGTAQGMWIDERRAGTATAGDESPYVTLTYDVVRPDEKVLFSVGLPELGPGMYTAVMFHDGPRQRAFGEVLPDALTCYEVQSGIFRPAGSPRVSFLLSLGSDRLRLEKREDDRACDGDPATWAFGGAPVTFVR